MTNREWIEYYRFHPSEFDAFINFTTERVSNADALATALETLAYTVDGLVPEKSRTVKDALSVARAALAAYRGAK